MNMKTNTRKMIQIGVAAAVAAMVNLAGVQAAVIADWQFTSNATLLDDSSGNGNTLANSGVTWSASNGGSAVFNGSAILNTVATLNLAPFTEIRVEWGMVTSQTAGAIVWESSVDANSVTGGMFGAINDPLAAGQFDSTARRNSGVVINKYALMPGDVGTVLHDYAVEISGSDLGTTQMKFFVDNVEVSSTWFQGPTASAQTFLNDTFFIGARSGGVAGFNGSLDYLTVSSVPEPSTWAMAALGLTVVVTMRRAASRA